MGIVSFDDATDDIEKECIISNTGSVLKNDIVPYKKEEEVVTILNTDKQLEKIVNYVDGSEWIVDYYLQAISENDEISRFDPNLPDTAAQYIKITQLILFVDSALNSDIASAVTGSAYINAGITPNQGDNFVATIMGGRKALLTVTDVDKKNYNLNDVYLIEYKVDVFLDGASTLVSSLEDKVVKRYFYDREFLTTNSTPLLLEEKYQRKRHLADELNDVIDYYFSTMFNKDKSVIAIPGQDSIIVDTMLQEFIFKIIDVNSNDVINRVNRLSVEDEYLKQPTVLDAIMRRDVSILNYSNNKFTVISTSAFNDNVRLRSIAYMGISNIVYPLLPDTSIGSSRASLDYDLGAKIRSVPNVNSSNASTDNLIPEYDESNQFYIFTEEFYNDDAENMSLLEGLVRMYMLNEVIDSRLLLQLINDYKYWNRVQQFFYIPILIILIRDSINRSFSNT